MHSEPVAWFQRRQSPQRHLQNEVCGTVGNDSDCVKLSKPRLADPCFVKKKIIITYYINK